VPPENALCIDEEESPSRAGPQRRGVGQTIAEQGDKYKRNLSASAQAPLNRALKEAPGILAHLKLRAAFARRPTLVEHLD
jgi:hypothetical protein